MRDAPTYQPGEKYDWKLMTVPDLGQYHIMIVDKMTELGMAGIPARIQVFANSEAGSRACRTLDARVREFLAGVNSKDDKSEPAPAETEKAAPKRAAGGKTRPKSAPSETAKRTAATGRKTKGETDMARTKATKGRKVAARANKAATARARTAYAPDAKIHVQPEGKPNPRREGTAAWKNYNKILENSGKTFAHYVEKGGRTPTLTRAVKEKLVKVA